MQRKSKLMAIVIAAALTGLLTLLGTATAGKRPECFGQKATIVGTKGDDTLDGTGNADVIVGRGGNDTITGGGSDDRICGNNGDDEVSGEDGQDRVSGGNGDDTVEGNVGSDNLQGGDGDDTVGSPDPCQGNCELNRNRINGGSDFDVCYTGQLDKVKRCEEFPNQDGAPFFG